MENSSAGAWGLSNVFAGIIAGRPRCAVSRRRLSPYLHRLFPGARPASNATDTGATLAVFFLSVALAHICFRYFERPFLRLKERFTFVPAREEVRHGMIR